MKDVLVSVNIVAIVILFTLCISEVLRILISWCVRSAKSKKEKIFTKINKLYDRAGLVCTPYRIFAIPINGATSDKDANVKHIRLGTPVSMYVYARTPELAKATFLANNPDYFIVGCWAENGIPKLKYA